MYFEEKGSVRYGRFHCFDVLPFIRAAFSTRAGGVSAAPFDQLNLGLSTDDDPGHVAENRRRFFEAIDVPLSSVAIQKQVHEARSAYVPAPAFLNCTDAAYTDRPGVFLTVSAADCVPILFTGKKRKVVGVIHAGWKGTLLRIAERTITKVKEQFEVEGEDMVAVIGPSISARNYEVGEELAGQFDPAFVVRNGYAKPHLDLWKANEAQLREAGIKDVFTSGLCTLDRQDLFFSHRGSGGRSGRMLGVIGIID